MSLKRSVLAPPVPKMPPGLIELMDGLARDVLKHNPGNIFEFCAHHMQTLLEMRDGHAPKPLITLEQKIAKAQQKINQRAEQRRRVYDEKLNLIESFKKQHALQLSDSERTEINEINDKPFEIKAEAKEETEVVNGIEKNEIEKLSKDNYIALESKDKMEIIHIVNDDDEKKEDNTGNDQELLNIGHDAKKETILTKITTEGNDSADCPDSTLSEENIVTLNEQQSIIIDMGKTEDNNDINNAIIPEENTVNVQLDMIPSDEKVITAEQESGLVLQNEQIDIDGEVQMETGVDNNVLNTCEIISVDNYINNETPLSPIVTNSDDTLKADNCVHVEKNEMQINSLSINDTLKQNFDKDSLQNHTGNLSEPDIKHDGKHEDDKILAVILSTNIHEPNFVINNEPDQVQDNEPDQKKEENLDLESAPETTDDKTRNMNNSMDLETAAITIQKVFRSFLFKTKTASYDDPTTVDINLLNEDKEKEDSNGLNINIKDRRPLGISRMDTVLQTVNEEKSLSLSTDDSSTLSSAATIIQAHVRGFLVRNKFNLNKTTSTNSLIDSDAPSIPSLEADSENRKSKTVLNIHIVPEGGHFVSRDESILTSMDLSLDSSPPSSVNLHPLGYDKSERRKLKREDAIQSVSPPSNNSGKLSDELDSVKEVLTGDDSTAFEQTLEQENNANNSTNILTNIKNEDRTTTDDSNIENQISDAIDEMDVITPFVPIEERSSRESDNSSKLLHSGEFHDIVVPTNVTRSDSSVVREFQNVLVYFILWNN